jgi:tripartite-type tricarboxylate transporter receptor subunit TctC
VRALFLALLVAAGAVQAQEWPAKAVRFVVPFPPGGTTDILARLVGQHLSEALGQTFVIDNRGGAGGNIGAAEVAKAAADGYTIMMGTPGTQAINQYIYTKMPYDTEKDFAPVSFVARVPNVIVVHPGVGVKSLQELIKYARANPNKLNSASPGAGTTGHLSLELFKSMTDTKIVHVTYGGAANSRIDLAAGRVQVAIDNVPSYLAEIQSGAVRMLAVGSTKRLESFPDVPTVEEAGLPGYEANVWYALAVRKGTPREIIDKVNRMANDALKAPDVAKRVRELHGIPMGGSPQDAEAFFAREAVRWKKVIEVSGAKAG